MYNFTTTRIINKPTNSLGRLYLSDNSKFTKKVTADSKNPKLVLENGLEFNKSNVKYVYKGAYKPASFEKLTIDLGPITTTAKVASHYEKSEEGIEGALKVVDEAAGEGQILQKTVGDPFKAGDYVIKVATYGPFTAVPGFYRLELHIKLNNSNDPVYANDSIFKSRPLFIEFTVEDGDTAKTVIERIIKYSKRYQSLLFGNSNIVILSKVEAQAPYTEITKFTIEATNEFQIFSEYSIQKLDESNALGKFEPIASVPIVKEDGNIGFGTYNHLISEIRLVTDANNRYTTPFKDEIPELFGNYTQYIITVETPRKGLMGTNVVGEATTSVTTHILWVNKFDRSIYDTETKTNISVDIITSLDTVLKAIAGNNTNITI